MKVAVVRASIFASNFITPLNGVHRLLVLVVSSALVITACGGGTTSPTSGSNLEDSEVLSDSSSALNFPQNDEEVVLFDNADDIRIMRFNVEDGFVGTLYGNRDTQGQTVESVEEFHIDDELQSPLIFKFPDAQGNAIALETKYATYTLSSDQSGFLLFRLDVEEQFIEYEVIFNNVEQTGIAKKLITTPEMRTARALNRAFVPSAEIELTGCSERVDNVEVRAYNQNGQLIDTHNAFRLRHGNTESYEAVFPGISRADGFLEDFAINTGTFLEAYDIKALLEEIVGGVQDGATEEVAELAERRSSELTDKLELVDQHAEYFGHSRPTNVIVETIDAIKRPVYKGLEIFGRFLGATSRALDVWGKYQQGVAVLEAGEAILNFRSALLYDRVSFETVVQTTDGRTIVGSRSALETPEAALAFLSADVPCVIEPTSNPEPDPNSVPSESDLSSPPPNLSELLDNCTLQLNQINNVSARQCGNDYLLTNSPFPSGEVYTTFDCVEDASVIFNNRSPNAGSIIYTEETSQGKITHHAAVNHPLCYIQGSSNPGIISGTCSTGPSYCVYNGRNVLY